MAVMDEQVTVRIREVLTSEKGAGILENLHAEDRVVLEAVRDGHRLASSLSVALMVANFSVDHLWVLCGDDPAARERWLQSEVAEASAQLGQVRTKVWRLEFRVNELEAMARSVLDAHQVHVCAPGGLDCVWLHGDETCRRAGTCSTCSVAFPCPSVQAVQQVLP